MPPTETVVAAVLAILLGIVSLAYLAHLNDRRKARDEFRERLASSLESEKELLEEIRSREAVMASDAGEAVKGMVEITLNAQRRWLAKTRESIAFYRRRLEE